MIKVHELLDLGFTADELLVFPEISDINDLPKRLRSGQPVINTIKRMEDNQIWIDNPERPEGSEDCLKMSVYDSYGVVYNDPDNKVDQFLHIPRMEYLYTDNLAKMDKVNIKFFLYALVPAFLVYFPSHADYMLAKALIPDYRKLY